MSNNTWKQFHKLQSREATYFIGGVAVGTGIGYLIGFAISDRRVGPAIKKIFSGTFDFSSLTHHEENMAD